MINKQVEKIMSYASPDEKIRIMFWKPKRKKYFEYLIGIGYSFTKAFGGAANADNEELSDYDKGCMEQTKK